MEIPWTKVVVEVDCWRCDGVGYVGENEDRDCFVCDGSGRQYQENVADVWNCDVYIEALYTNLVVPA